MQRSGCVGVGRSLSSAVHSRQCSLHEAVHLAVCQLEVQFFPAVRVSSVIGFVQVAQSEVVCIV